MRVELSERARRSLEELDARSSLLSTRQVVEAALWGIEGPGRELSDRLWEQALGRNSRTLLSEDLTEPRGIRAEEVLGRLRATVADRQRDESERIAVYLGEEATRHVELFVRAGIYDSAEAAVEAALLAAVTFNTRLPESILDPW